MTSKRGEIWLTSFDPVVGHEQAGRRPALILSVDEFNASRAELVTVLPITSKLRAHIPSRIEVRPPEGGLKVRSYIIGEQPRTIASRRLIKRMGTVSVTTMSKVADVVRILLGL
jgi:mRNA interferase MazF